MALIRKSDLARARGEAAPPPAPDPEVEAFMGNRGKGKRRASGPTNAQMERALGFVENVVRDRENADWSRATPIHFVALWAYMHGRVYRVHPVMSGPDRRRALFLAAAILNRQLEGDPDEMAEFMRWTWRREMRNEERAREGGYDRRPMGWQLQFSAGLLTEWMVAEKRNARGAR